MRSLGLSRQGLSPFLLASLLVVSAPVLAQGQPAPSWLDEMAVIDAQIQLLQKRDELEMILEQRAASRSAVLPGILSIIGFDGRFTAELVFPNGRIGRFRLGDEVSPDILISGIHPRGVMVTVWMGDGEFREAPLEFVSPPSAAQAAGDLGADRPSVLRQAIRPSPPTVHLTALTTPAPTTATTAASRSVPVSDLGGGAEE